MALELTEEQIMALAKRLALKPPMFCTHCKYTSPLAVNHCGVRCPICLDECGGTMTHTKDQALSTSVVQQCKCSDAGKTRVLEWRTQIWTLETVIRSLMTQYKCNAQDPRVVLFVKQRMDLLLKKAPRPAEPVREDEEDLGEEILWSGHNGSELVV